MRDRDLELIAALVEGRLEDESEARALIASSDEARQEYEAQRMAYDALSGAGTVSLSDSERSRLRRDIWTELRSGSGPETSKTPWYYIWVPVAAGMLVMVGLVAILAQGGAGDSAEQIVAADETTTTAAADSDLSAADDAGGDGAGESQSETTTRQEESAGADAPAGESTSIYQREAEMLRQGVFGDQLRSYDAEDAIVEACVAESGLDNHRVLATLSAPTETTETAVDQTRVAVALAEDAQLATAPLFFVDLDTCEVVYTDE